MVPSWCSLSVCMYLTTDGPGRLRTLHSLSRVVLLSHGCVSLSLMVRLRRLLSHPLLSQVPDSMIALCCLMVCPVVFKITPLISSWRFPIRLWVLPRDTLWCWMVSSAYFTSHWLWWWFEDLVHPFHYKLYHGLYFVHLVPTRVTWASCALTLCAGYRLILPIDVTVVI